MRSIAIVVVLASCSSPPQRPVALARPSAPVKARNPPLGVAAFLAPPIGRRAARVVVQGPGQLALGEPVTAAGAPLDACDDLEVAVLDERDGWVRIVEQATDVALALWIPMQYLGDVVTVKTPLVATRGAAPTVWLMPGAPVRVVERDGGHARVELRHLNDRAQGWIEAGALGRTYRRAAIDAMPDRSARVDTTQAVLDAPSTSATSVFSTAFGGPYERIGDRHGYTELRYRSAWLDARGFVATSGIATPPPTGMCESVHNRFLVGAVLDSMPSGQLAVPAGTCLRAEVDGPVVGVQRVDAVRDVYVERSGAWAQAVVAVTLGTYAVWMRVERVDGELAIVPGC